MEHQSLVDIAICCGNNTLHAHKCILAANSTYFREELEKNSSIEQIVMLGFDFAVLKAIIEFMYCGETVLLEEHVKYLIAAAKLFKIKGLDILFSDRQEYQNITEEIFIPYPHFITSKPKYPAYHPFENASISSPVLKPVNYNPEVFNQRKMKRKYIRTEAEKACAKEAQASRMALANLQKEIATTPQVNSFVIEESCTETTVENFIPPENFQETRVINYADLDNEIYDTKPNLMHFPQNVPQELTADKIKHILGNEVPQNIEIMFKTSEGNYVTVTDEVLQNISKGGLQYQVVDENGQVGEIQDLKLIDKSKNNDFIKDFTKAPMEGLKSCENDRKPLEYLLLNNVDFENGSVLPSKMNFFSDLKNDDMDIEKDPEPIKFSPDIFFADLTVDQNKDKNEDKCDMISLL